MDFMIYRLQDLDALPLGTRLRVITSTFEYLEGPPKWFPERGWAVVDPKKGTLLLSEHDTIADAEPVSDFEMVSKFMTTFGHEIPEHPRMLDHTTQALRFHLINEELQEYRDAVATGDMVEAFDALLDLIYVVQGAGLAHGFPMDLGMAEVQRSNMSKLGEDGKPLYGEYGRVEKGPTYSPPDLQPILEEAARRPSVVKTF